jgi:hypothetical protein
MEGLYYYHDFEGLTFLHFYPGFPNGRVISIGKYTKLDQCFQAYPWLRLDSDFVQFSRGFYEINEGNKIRIVIKGDFGKLVYRGTIRKNGTIELSYKCPISNAGKSATFLRFSEENHIIHIELSDISIN